MNLVNNPRKALFIIPLLLLISCSTRNKDALFQSKYDTLADTTKSIYIANPSAPIDSAYKIKATDAIAIRNLQDLTLVTSGTVMGAQSPSFFVVEKDGTVLLPVIGRVKIGGLTRLAATTIIQSIYKEKLLKDPLIDLSIINLKVTLLGEFNKQGNFLLEKESTSIVEMIGLAGGLTPQANPRRLKIIRGDRKNPEIIYLNLTDINSLASNKVILQNNDLLYLPPTGAFAKSERIKTYSVVIQPVLAILNVALIIYSLAR